MSKLKGKETTQDDKYSCNDHGISEVFDQSNQRHYSVDHCYQ